MAAGRAGPEPAAPPALAELHHHRRRAGRDAGHLRGAWALLAAVRRGRRGPALVPDPPAGFTSSLPQSQFAFYIWWIFAVNYGLFVFNMLLVFYPFDGGRMMQELLWVRLGYYRSMQIATPSAWSGRSG